MGIVFLLIRRHARFWPLLGLAWLCSTARAYAQSVSPWEQTMLQLGYTFQQIARPLAMVAVIVGGLMWMFGEAGAKRQIAGILFGGGLALSAANFIAWMF